MNEHSRNYNALKQTEASLPARWYFDNEHYRRELKEIWHRSWVYVCRLADLAEPGSFRTVEIGDQNIIILRNEDGGVAAYHNACRHRGSLLCTERQGKLKSKLLVCPYHQWAYAADDGRLVKTSSFAEPEGFDKKDYPLFGVASGVWRGLIFVNLDAGATWKTETAFHREPANLDNFPIEEMVTVHTWRKVMACNWKTFWENFNECLHCPNVHPELSDLVPMYGRRIVNTKDVPDWADHEDTDDPKFRGGLRSGSETWSMDGSAQGHVISSLTPDEVARGQTYGVALPGMFAGAYADHIRIVRLLPISAEETELVAEWLIPPETAAAADYDVSQIVDFAKLVMDQDLGACELNQRGLHAAPLQQGVLMPEEYHVKHFQDWVRAQLGQNISPS